MNDSKNNIKDQANWSAIASLAFRNAGDRYPTNYHGGRQAKLNRYGNVVGYDGSKRVADFGLAFENACEWVSKGYWVGLDHATGRSARKYPTPEGGIRTEVILTEAEKAAKDDADLKAIEESSAKTRREKGWVSVNESRYANKYSTDKIVVAVSSNGWQSWQITLDREQAAYVIAGLSEFLEKGGGPYVFGNPPKGSVD